MFIDEVTIEVEGGRGGDGCVSFYREYRSRKRRPDGGDGGKGGDVIVAAGSSVRTLLDYRYRRKYRAGKGGNGGSQEKTGRRGRDLVLLVPLGTQVRDLESGRLLGDLVEEDSKVVVCKGGEGGRGNARTWRLASQVDVSGTPLQRGKPGEARTIRLELKLIADVGLVGKPNSGKSTLLRNISNARPKVGDYPFTTKEPVLGLVKWRDFDSFVVADIPGLIDGAASGRGLGHRFLRHVERTRLILVLVEATADDYRAEVEKLRSELAAYSPELAAKPYLVAVNKCDLLAGEQLDRLSRDCGDSGFMVISALTGSGLVDLVDILGRRLMEIGGEPETAKGRLGEPGA